MDLPLILPPRLKDKRLMVRVYSCLSSGFDQLQLHGKGFAIEEVVVGLHFGPFTYGSIRLAVPHLIDGQFQVGLKQDTIEAPAAPYLVLTVECDDEPRATRRLDWASGVLHAFWGPNVVFGLETEFWVESDGRTTISSQVERGPEPPEIRITPQTVAELKRRLIVEQALPEPTRQRLETSVRWYRKGVQSRGVDAVIALWTAFESLTTSRDPTDDLNQIARNCYSTTEPKALGLGLLHGLRSNIVHDGWIGGVHADVIEYYRRHWENLYWFVAARVKAPIPSTKGLEVDALEETLRLCRLARPS